MTEECIPYHELQRELELIQCKLRRAQLDIRDLKQENEELKDKLKQLLQPTKQPCQIKPIPPDTSYFTTEGQPKP